MEVPVHAGSGSLACAAGHARAAKRLASGHQLAFGEEPVSHARQERLGMAVLAAVSPGGVARYDDRRLRSAARSATAVGTGLSLARARSEEHTSELQSLRHLVCRLL